MVAPAPQPAEPAPIAEPAGPCPNCGAEQVGQFCAGCGQRRPGPTDYALRPLLLAAVAQLAQYDNRILRTLRALLTPGQITRDHFEGRRARYVDPFQTFVLFNLAAWVIIPHAKITGFTLPLARKLSLAPVFWSRMLDWRAASLGLTAQQFAARVEAVIPSENRLTVLAMVPLFALGVALFLHGRGFKPVQHLIFGVHFYCVFLTLVIGSWALVLGPVLRHFAHHATGPAAAAIAGFLMRPWVQHLFVAPMILPYLFFAIRRVYGLGTGPSAWRAAGLTLWACTLSRAFIDIACALVLVFV